MSQEQQPTINAEEALWKDFLIQQKEKETKE